MKTKHPLIIHTLLLLGALIPAAKAQPSGFTYQGNLNQNGLPANGTFDFQFALFPAASGGFPPAGTNQVSAVTTSNGLFTATLDFGTSPFGTNPLWLEISVRPSGSGAFTTLTPRQLLTPAPFAITSVRISGTLPQNQLPANVAFLDQSEVFSGLVSFTTNVGIGTTSPSAKLDVAGAVAVNGTKIIDATGKWVGSPTGIQGPVGPQGPAGPQGPVGPAVHTVAICGSGSAACWTICGNSLKVVAHKEQSFQCQVTSDTGTCSYSDFTGTEPGYCCVCSP